MNIGHLIEGKGTTGMDVGSVSWSVDIADNDNDEK